MKRTYISKICILFFTSLVSCSILGDEFNCPDDVHHDLPDEAIWYYNEHDTIRFYSEEIDEFEEFIVCSRVEEFEYDVIPDRCEQKTYYYTRNYFCYKDSCNSDEYFWLHLTTLKHHDVNYHGSYTGQRGRDNLSAIFDEKRKIPVEILGHTYDNTIYIGSQLYDSLVGIRYNHEYGVIQRKYEHATFNLINEDNKFN